MRSAALGVGASILFALSAAIARAEERASAADVNACIERNFPEPDTIRAVRFVSRDRLGSEQVIVLKMYGRRNSEGLRQLLLRFVEPEDVRGASLLVLEQEEGSEIYLKSPDLPDVKRITASGRSQSLFGTDFSYEDFERIQAVDRTGKSTRLEDETIGDRPVYVVETRTPEDSAYETVVSYIDKKTCMALRMEFFEPGPRLRKVLTVNPSQVLKRGSIWIAHMAALRDNRDFTTTQLLVDSTEQDILIPDGMFNVEEFQRAQP